MSLKNQLFPFAICALFLFFSCEDKEEVNKTIILTDFTPKSGSEGTIVTISGQNFNEITSENHVFFPDELPAEVLSSTPNQLEVRVPTGASTGSIYINSEGQKIYTHRMFEVPGPIVESFYPVHGKIGSLVTITGKNFSLDPANIRVVIGSEAIIKQVNSTEIIVEISSEARGRAGIEVKTAAGRTVTEDYFTIMNDIWLDLTPFEGGARRNGIGFSIYGQVYVGLGNNLGESPSLYRDFWEYNKELDQWRRMQDFPDENGLQNGVSFVVDDKAYVGMNHETGEFWRFDPLENKWTSIAPFGGSARFNPIAFSIGKKGYVGLGIRGNTGLTDFWEFDSETGEWKQLSNFPGFIRFRSTGFSVNGKGYVTTGYSETLGRTKEFWQYDPQADKWAKKADFPGEVRTNAVSFGLKGKGYVGTGEGSSRYLGDFWRYDPEHDTWDRVSYVTGTSGGGIGFSDGENGFILTGYRSPSTPAELFKIYYPE